MSKKIEVTLVKSMIGRPEKHKKILRSLGLNKLNKMRSYDDNPSVRGMINKVKHLVSYKEL